MKFAHLGDCHLGSWRHPQLENLNFQSFKYAIDFCIKEKVDFILIAGDLFDSAYPPIDILKETFAEFKKLKDIGIPVFLIAGSHDYSFAGKTFLDVLEKAGFCKNVSIFEEKNSITMLLPTIYKNYAIYGYSGKKTGLEVNELSGMKIQDAPGMFKILMLHTAVREAIGNLPINAIRAESLPKADYIALGHLHIDFIHNNLAYSGPIFPNNILELEELKYGSFCIFDNGKIRKEAIKLIETLVFDIKITNSFSATDEILSAIKKENLKNKIIILKISGILEQGKSADIDFKKIENHAYSEGAFVILKNTSKLHLAEPEIKFDALDSQNIESQIIKKFESTNPSRFNSLVPMLLKSLQTEKMEDEKSSVFEERLLLDAKKIIGI